MHHLSQTTTVSMDEIELEQDPFTVITQKTFTLQRRREQKQCYTPFFRDLIHRLILGVQSL